MQSSFIGHLGFERNFFTANFHHTVDGTADKLSSFFGGDLG